jgi:hypothetical protein
LLSAVVVAVAAIVPRGGTVRAEEPDTSQSAPAIVVTFDPNAVEEERVVAAVKAHLSGLPVRVLVKPVVRTGSLGRNVATAGALATASGALGTSSIEVGDDGAFLIFFTEPGGASTLIRRLPPSDEGIRVTVEEASIVVRSLVLALLEGRRIGMANPADAPARSERPQAVRPPREKRRDRASPPPKRSTRPGSSAARPATTEDAPAENAPAASVEDALGGTAGDESPSARRSAAVTAAYAGTHFATNMTWQSGFTPGVRWTALRWLYVAGRYTFFPKLEGGTNDTAVSIARHPVELAVGYVGTTRLAANAELGFVYDHTTRQTRSNAPGYEPTPTARRSSFAVTAKAGASFTLVPAVQLALRGGADFLLTKYAYVMPDGSSVVSPRGVRPRLDLELAMSLW